MVNTIKHPFTGHEVRVRESLVGTGVVISDLADSQMIVVHPESAPALALAILEAAGHGKATDSIRLMQAFDLIELHVKEQERNEAEAKEQAELEAEALELFKAGFPDGVEPPEIQRDMWLAVARKSRELRDSK